jgi:hypothetical protein
MLDSLCRLCRALNEHEVNYLLVGGHAVAAHGYPRATQDVDLVVALTPENTLRAIAALTSIGYKPFAPVPAQQFCDPTMRETWRREKGAVVFQMCSANPIDFPVDLFVSEPFDFWREHGAAVRVEIGPDLFVPVVTLRTLIAMKRPAGRDKDKLDLQELEKMGIAMEITEDKPKKGTAKKSGPTP